MLVWMQLGADNSASFVVIYVLSSYLFIIYSDLFESSNFCISGQ